VPSGPAPAATTRGSADEAGRGVVS
jgi:hypothetical protein